MARRAGLLALGLLIILGGWVVIARTTRGAGGSAQFVWRSELWGYGGFRALLGDLDGDGLDELVLQGMAGEAEGQEPLPALITALYRYDPGSGRPVKVGRTQDMGPLVALADLDGDGAVELLARSEWDGPLEGWLWDGAGDAFVRAPGELLERYEARGGFLPKTPSPLIANPVQDLDGDGLLDRLEVTRTDGGAELRLTTRAGQRGLPLAALLGGGAAELDQLRVEAWRPEEEDWPWLLVGARLGDGRTHLSVWVPSGAGYRLAWERTLARRGGPYHLPPAWALLDLTGDRRPELVVGEGGVVEVLAWRDGAFQPVARTPENGGLGWAGLFAADLDGDGRRELIARHVRPDLYTHHLKIYRLRGDRLLGLADVNAIGHGTGGPTLTWRWGDREVLLLPRQFEQARPEALGLAL